MRSSTILPMPKIMVGDTWKDLDPRRSREIIVREISSDCIYIQTKTGGPIVSADASRFIESAIYKSGFVLVSRAEPAQESASVD